MRVNLQEAPHDLHRRGGGAGARTTFQDLGRPGYAHLGVPVAGACDRAALTLANRLVGNPEQAVGLETTLVGPSLRFLAPCTIALAGAPVDATLDGRPVSMHAPTWAKAGQVLALGTARRGLRTYLAVRGGLEAPRTLGSASTDQLTGLGPPPLADGQELALAGAALEPPAVDVAPVAEIPQLPVLPLRLGPREDALAPDAVTALLSERFSVTTDVDRIGVRLIGPALPHRSTEELRSEGMVAGSVQVPPSGEAIIMLADHPTTGGYPVVGVVEEAALSLVAQLRRGRRCASRPWQPGSVAACRSRPTARASTAMTPAPEPDEEGRRDPLGNIARRVIQLQKEYLGKGPTKARVHANDEMVVVMLREPYTVAEQTLARSGQIDALLISAGRCTA